MRFLSKGGEIHSELRNVSRVSNELGWSVERSRSVVESLSGAGEELWESATDDVKERERPKQSRGVVGDASHEFAGSILGLGRA